MELIQVDYKMEASCPDHTHGISVQIGVMELAFWSIAIKALLSIRLVGADAKKVADSIWWSLKDFKHFEVGGNNLATVKIESSPDGKRRFGGFDTVTSQAFPMSFIAGEGWTSPFCSAGTVWVELFTNSKKKTIQAVTLGNHMIVGSRQWGVKILGDGRSVLVWTSAYEQRHGWLTDRGFWNLGGQSDMRTIWGTYLNNIGSWISNTRQYPYENGIEDWRIFPSSYSNPYRN